jgi:hypothetical protein
MHVDGLGVLAIAAMLAVVLAYALLVIGAVVGILRSPQPGGMKLVWLVFVVVAPFLGSALWFLVGRGAVEAATS